MDIINFDRNEVEKFIVQQMMIKFGGSFVKCLGEALAHAGAPNAARIKDTFSDYWIKYVEMYRQLPDETKKEINQGYPDNF